MFGAKKIFSTTGGTLISKKIEKFQKNQKCLFWTGKPKKHVLDMFGAKKIF